MPAESLEVTGLLSALAAAFAAFAAFVGKRKLKRLDELEHTVTGHGAALSALAGRLDELEDTLPNVQKVAVANLVVTAKLSNEIVRILDRLRLAQPEFEVDSKGLEKVIDLAYEDLRQLGVRIDK